MKKAEVCNFYTMGKTYEISVDYNGWNFLMIFGEHINGWFIALPNHGVCCEAASPRDTFYNSERLTGAFKGTALEEMDAGPLAEMIRDYYLAEAAIV